MKRISRKIGLSILLLSMVMFVIPVNAQSPVPPIPPEVEAEKDRLLAEYQKALEFELENGQTIINPEDGKTKMLIGESKEKIDLLWQETVQNIEILIARPASEREPIENLIKEIDGNQPIYLERFTLPYNPSAALERYQTGNFFYTVDIATSQIVDISPVGIHVFPKHNLNEKGVYSESELETLARTYIKKVAGEIDLDTLMFVLANKEGRVYFFRWEDSSGALEDGTAPFIQVSISSIDGQVRHYVNTLPIAITRSQTFFQEIGLFPKEVSAAFTEVYANGGSFWGWLNNGGSADTTSNAGYCYIAGWCSPKNFYWSWTDATTSPQNEPYIRGRWNTNVTTESTRSYAFIPSTNATAYARYTTTINNGASTVDKVIDQEIYYNVWVFLVGYYSQVTRVALDNNDDIAGYKVAWDEVMLCSLGTCP
jgi:hypothetical protein